MASCAQVVAGRLPKVDLYVDDAGFVRAAPDLVERRLRDVARWPDWWPGLRVRSARSHTAPRPTTGTEGCWMVETRGAVGRRLRWSMRSCAWRAGHGVVAELEGDLCGRAEVWLEGVAGGTVVHHVLAARTPLPHPDRVLADHRRAVRQGLWGLKDLLHLEVRTSTGFTP